MFLQLAISKEGIIAGTYQNKTTEQAQSVEGTVDQKGQRAAWVIGDRNTLILETDISNFTQNEAVSSYTLTTAKRRRQNTAMADGQN